MIRESSLELFSFKMERDGTSGVDADRFALTLRWQGRLLLAVG
jgi:hypothetical protein